MSEEHDIVARVTNADTGNSVGALAAYIGRSCGHVSLDDRVIVQGYRFYPEMSDEIPAFFNKRFTTGSVNLAITLQAGLALDGGDPFESCMNTRDARTVVEDDQYEASLWLARVTVGTDLLDVRQIVDPLFIARWPSEFRLIAEELVSLGIVQEAICPLCGVDEGTGDGFTARREAS